MRKLKIKILLAILFIFVLIFTQPIHISSKRESDIQQKQENTIKYESFAEYQIRKLQETKEEIKVDTNEINYTEDELYWLAKIVYAEAFYDCDEGQQAVANVVINRVNHSEFPDTIYNVIWQKTGKLYQFSPCADGGINREPDERAYENAKVILEGKRILPENVLFFYMPTEGNKNDWIRTREVYDVIGVHRFCY